MRVPLFWRVLPVYMVMFGLFAVPIMQRQAAMAQAQQAADRAKAQLAHQPPKAVRVAGQPERIILPRLEIDLKVVSGSYSFDKAEWSVSPDTANYAASTTEPNNRRDKTLIYGHWTQQVFGRTQDLVPGDIAYVYTSGNHIFEYRYQSKNVIKPTDTAVLDSFKGKTGLVLMTCQGAWAQERRLMYFNLVHAS